MAKPIINPQIFKLPKFENNREKQQAVKNIRQQRRVDLKNANSRDEKTIIKETAKNQIKELRGGKTQVGEIIEDTQKFAKQLNEMKALIMGTTAGLTYKIGSSLVKNVASGNVQGVINNTQRAVNLITGKGNKKTKQININDSCNCNC